ncbi:M48 family metallopeptidase [Gracilimonas sp.]|uniref:M48 family metallopeptidase n=1 Tax=Gracilimonas sp. TaxID=1974203 RepID=UPI0028728D0D|nr:SprT family zinc-dependent metalloprotease [Gracilimonas sp.]
MPRYKTFSKQTLSISGIEVNLHRKNVKNLNLRVYPSKQEVKISVPRHAPEKAVMEFVKAKIPWIKKHLSRKISPKPSATLNFVNGEKHLFFGNEFELRVVEKNSPPEVIIEGNHTLILQVRPGADINKKAKVLKEWYRAHLKKEIPLLIQKWEPIMGVSVQEFGVKAMKTRWGTCNIRDRRIWLNLELAKKRPELLEYVVVHEMVHLLERLHNKRFYGFMSQFLPNWKSLKAELNKTGPLSNC